MITRGFVVLGIILVVFYLVTPAVMITPPSYSREAQIAVKNAKSIYEALCRFEEVYGHFPTSEIPVELQEKYPQTNRTDSNYVLGQLIAAGLLESEDLFSIKRPIQSDNNTSSPEEILSAGECQFSYVSQAGKTPMSLSYGSSATPILLFPMVPNTEQFDPEYYDNQKYGGYYLSLDGQLQKSRLNEKGEGLLKGQGKITLFTFGEDTIWGEDKPVINHPLPYNGAPKDSAQEEKQSQEKMKNLLYAVILLAVISVFSIPAIKNSKLGPGT